MYTEQLWGGAQHANYRAAIDRASVNRVPTSTPDAVICWSNTTSSTTTSPTTRPSSCGVSCTSAKTPARR
jgi:hypothetical protein